MNIRKQGSLLVLSLMLAFGLVFQSQAASYPAPIKYNQTMVRVFTESQVSGWLSTYGRYFPEMAVSANGAKIGFTVQLDGHIDKHLYVANADGTGLMDVTGSVPDGKLSQNVTSLQMNDTGSRLFFRDLPTGDIFYLGTASPYSSHVALLGAAWVDARKPYTLDALGNTLFLKHQVAPSGIWRIGLYSCPVGGTPAIVFNIDQITHTVDWNLRYLGSGKVGPLFFLFDQDYWSADDFFMYKTGATPTRLPNETHQYIWDEQNLPNSIVSADGSKILYGYADPSTPRQLHLVDTATGAKSFILQTSSLGLAWPNLSPDASLARISTSRFRASRIDLKTLAARDTASYWFGEYGTIGASAGLSDITLDNRRYFLASKKAANNAAIHCIDMAPTDFSQAPNITNIAFNRPFLPFDDTKFITVTAQLGDANGLGNLEWVHILSLWDGVELPPEGMIYMPLWFGSDLLYDNGTHGDLVAGDGIYTNNTITVQKWSEFYKWNRLPKKVGLRLIAKNKDSNYTIADTEFMVGNPGGLSIPPTLQLLLD
jgi:hypothetical protein